MKIDPKIVGAITSLVAVTMAAPPLPFLKE